MKFILINLNEMDSNLEEKFYYVYSSSLDTRVQIKIGPLVGKRKKPDYKKLLSEPMLKFSELYSSESSELMVICQVFSYEKPLTLPTSTSYKSFTNRCYGEWISLPVMFSDLPRNAQLAITIYDCIGAGEIQPVGGTTISLFGKHGVFRQGMFDLKVWPNKVADGNCPTTTPGKTENHEKEEMKRLAKVKKKHLNGQINKVDWLDRLTFREIEVLNEQEKRNSGFLYLTVEFPKIEFDNTPHSVVYFEPDGDEVYPFRAHADIVTVPDYEILQENLVESKHHMLARCVRSGVSDRDAKPTAQIRHQLNLIVAYPPTKTLTTEEQDLVWKYRFYLTNQKKALTKFLKCINWKLSIEATQALALVRQWAPMDVEDALELLGPNFEHPGVRRYAVSRLAQAPDEDLFLYLLQLVQALKYENFEDIKEKYNKLCQENESVISSAREFKDSLSERHSATTDQRHSVSSSQESSFHGQTMTDSQSGTLGPSPTTSTTTSSMSAVTSSPTSLEVSENNSTTQAQPYLPPITSASTLPIAISGDQDLATFLIARACDNSTLANFFYWFLLIECEDQDPAMKQDTKVREMYLNVLKTFSKTLQKGGPEWQKRRAFLKQQQTFIDKLVRLVKIVARESGNRKKKIEHLKNLLADSETFKINFSNFQPIPFPLDPEVKIKGIIAKKATLFKSSLMPSRLTFLTCEGEEYVAIFKYGDDLRQDQLILQMITLMDKLLRRENLDLKLTPYKVHATSARHGFVQFIESTPVAEVLATENTIQNFFRKHHPQENGPYGIAPEVMDTYIRSCAGYCVITYLLGVGDRHLDNLLLTTNGNLFHIDFGYILGRDPKPLPPPMKLSKEMVEAMGGTTSEHYQEFRKQCYTAFLHLRRHANLMLNLFSLMVDANVPDIALEPDKAVKKVQDKLRLDLGDEEAVHYFQNLLDMSVTAVMAVLVDHLHKFAQYWRK